MPQSSVSVRFNPFKPILEEQYFDGQLVPWNTHGLILDERPKFTLDPLFHAGCYYVQDSSAMFVGHIFRKLLSRYEGNFPRVLDLCAAPGGKTTDLAASLRERFADQFELVSNEVMKNRASILRDNVSIWGDPNVIVTSVDPAAFASMEGYFDIIVADVPCSGEGMFRKDARAVQEWSESVVDLCAARQKRILADIWPALKKGGALLYSTCTYEQAENDDNLEWAASQFGGSIIPPEDEFAQFGVELTRHGSLLRAGVVPGEGQWAGALIKDGVNSGRSKRATSIEQLRPIWQGYNGAVQKGRDLIPDPSAPLNINFDTNQFPQIELDLATALKYLHRDSLVLNGADLGYNVVCYRSHPLGFVKNIGSRCNNLLPKSRKILMDV